MRGSDLGRFELEWRSSAGYIAVSIGYPKALFIRNPEVEALAEEFRKLTKAKIKTEYWRLRRRLAGTRSTPTRPYGKPLAIPALNFGDCFAYACAKQSGVPLIYKGDDFAHTDLA